VTLQLASILDERLAKSIERVRPWMIDNFHLPPIGEMEEGNPYSDLVTLAGIGSLVLTDSAISVENPAISCQIRP
jgi:hypothetical protein